MSFRTLSASIAILVLFAFSPAWSADGVLLFPPEIAGSWSGTCTSAGGHKGPVQATICRLDENHYRAVFSGRVGVLPFRNSVDLQMTGVDGDKLVLTGTVYLGIGPGTMRIRILASSNELIADYTSPKSNGQYLMHRNGY